MKKLMLSAAMLVVMTGAANAQFVNGGPSPLATVNQSLTINMNAAEPAVCGVSAGSLVDPEAVDIRNTSAQTLTSLGYVCNVFGGFTRTITSQNGGALEGAIAGNTTEIPYTLSHTGGSGIAFNNEVPTIVDSLTANFFNQQTGSLRVTPGTPTGPVFADTYTDTLTVSISF